MSVSPQISKDMGVLTPADCSEVSPTPIFNHPFTTDFPTFVIGKTSPGAGGTKLLKNGLFKLMSSRTCLHKLSSVAIDVEVKISNSKSELEKALTRFKMASGFGKKIEKQAPLNQCFISNFPPFASATCQEFISSLLQRFRKLQHGIPSMDLACLIKVASTILHPSIQNTNKGICWNLLRISHLAICWPLRWPVSQKYL